MTSTTYYILRDINAKIWGRGVKEAVKFIIGHQFSIFLFKRLK